MKMKKGNHTGHVIIGGELLFYDAKAPYEKSGMSIRGALEYDAENDLVKCHECGEFFRQVGNHAAHAHKMNARQYKIRHGLLIGTALINESTRCAFIAEGIRRFKHNPQLLWDRMKKCRLSLTGRGEKHHRTAEDDNSKRLCDIQIIDRLRQATQQLGRPPTKSEMLEFGFNAKTARCHFGSLKALFRLAGIQGREGCKWENRTLLAFISNFIQKHGREPHQSDCDRGLIPSYAVYWRRFGSLRRGVTLARKRQFRACDLPTETRIRPVSAAKARASRQRFWGVNIGKFAIGGTRESA